MENSKFRATQEDIDMSAINTMFNRRDTQRVVENYEASMRTSNNNRRRPRRRVTNAKKFLTAIAALAMAGGITIGAFVNQTINDMPKGSLNSISGQIGEIVFVKGDDFIEGLDRTDVSILSQNTKRNAIDYYYNHEGIAKDLLKLDDELLDIGFCSVCENMAENKYNKVGPNKETNVDLVIENIKRLSPEGSYAEESFGDVDNLDEWLLKNHFVDKEGKPSLRDAIDFYSLRVNDYIPIIEAEKQAKEGAKLQ